MLCNIKERAHRETGPRSHRNQEMYTRKRHRHRLDHPLAQVEPLVKDHIRAIFAAKGMHNDRALDDTTGKYMIIPIHARTATSNGFVPTFIGLTSRQSTVMSPTQHRTRLRGPTTGSQIPQAPSPRCKVDIAVLAQATFILPFSVQFLLDQTCSF